MPGSLAGHRGLRLAEEMRRCRPDPLPEYPGDGDLKEPSVTEPVPDGASDAGVCSAAIDSSRRFPQGRSSELMARLTLSVLERASTDPSLWREPLVHRPVLVSGLSVLMGSLTRLEAELERWDSAR